MKRDLVRQLLADEGPMTSSDLLRRMEAANIAPPAARKRLQRLGDEVRRLYGYGLPNNQQLLYLQDDWLSPRFIERLRDAWHEGNSAHGNALAALPSDGTALPLSLMHTRSGVPLALKGQVSFERILEQLEKLERVRADAPPELAERCIFAGRAPSRNAQPIQRTRAVLLSERVLLAALRDWLRKSAFASYEKIRVRGDDQRPEFSRWPYDLVGPSYVRPLGSRYSRKPRGRELGVRTGVVRRLSNSRAERVAGRARFGESRLFIVAAVRRPFLWHTS